MEQQSAKVEFANTLRGIAALLVMFGKYYLIFWRHRDIATNLPNAMLLSPEIVAPSYIYTLNFFKSFSFGIFGRAIFFLIGRFVNPLAFVKTNWRGLLIAVL